MKKILTLILALLSILLLTVLSANSTKVSAETYSGSCGTNVTWNLDTSTGELTISGNGSMDNYDPGYNTAPWYAYKTSIKTVTIKSGVTSIGEEAFYGCTELTSITIPDSVTSIGEGAFYECTGLTSITIPDSVTSIGDYAFEHCTGLTNVTIGNSVTSIGEETFYDCTELTSITIGNSVTSIGDHAFSECTGLKSITIPDSVTSIGSGAFYGCTGLKSITIPDSVTSIGSGAFDNTAWYNNQVDGLIYAGKVAYRYKGTCPSNITIKDGTTQIYGGAFYGCTGLKSITIPDSVTSIGMSAFQYCTGLTSITIPNSVTYIDEDVFADCTGLTNVTIGNSVTSIYIEAFASCTGLKSITIPDSVTSIGFHAFSGCPDLTILGAPGSVAETYAKNNDIPFVYVPVISAAESIIAPGEEAELTFEISGNTGISVLVAGVELPEGVTLTGVTNGDVFSSAEIGRNIVLEASGVQSAADGKVVTLKLKAADTLLPGSYTVKPLIYECCGGDETVVAVRTVPATLTVKNRQAAPAAPTASQVTSGSVTLTAVSGAEYSLDGENWQTSNVFEGLSPATEYTFYARFPATDTAFESEVSEGAKVTTLKLTAAAPAAPVIEKTEATKITLTTIDGAEYSLDKTTWQTSNVFEGLSPATEYTFYARYAETDTTYASSPSEGARVKTLKNTIQPPYAPGVVLVEAEKISLEVEAGVEYSKDGENWQRSNIFRDLTPNTEYTFYTRYYETDMTYASAASEGTKATTPKRTVAAPAAPVIEKTEATKVTLTSIDGAEYSLDKTNWQTSNVFEGLSPVTGYTFYARYAETETSYVSEASEGTLVTTPKLTVAAPAAPAIEKNEATKVTLVQIDGAEYSLDKTSWQTSNVFEGLSPATGYTFYARFPETETAYVSEASEGTSVTTPKLTVAAPAAPAIEKNEATKVTLVQIDGAEYSLDKTSWQTSNVFEGLSPATEYTFYARYAETETSYVSEASEGTTVTTPKLTVEAPAAPVIETSAARKVTLVPVDGAEYSKDGENWQASGVFEGLDPFESYTFFIRLAETDTSYASAASEGTSVGVRPLYGDANADGKVTALDLIRLKKYIASVDADGRSAIFISREADVNVDKKYDSLDVVRLKRYFAEYDPSKGKSTVVLGPAA